jgi:hypothetical protein
LSLLAKNYPFDSPDGYLLPEELIARNRNRVQKNLQHKPLLFSPPPSPPCPSLTLPPSVPLKGPTFLPFATVNPSFTKVTLKVFSSVTLTVYFEVLFVVPFELDSLLWRDPDRIFQGHLDRVLRNEIDLVKNSNSCTVKKRYASFPSPAGISLPNSPWAGIMTS